MTAYENILVLIKFLVWRGSFFGCPSCEN